MLSCIVGKKKIYVFDKTKEELRRWSKKGLLKCPVCNEELIYRHGELRVPHFAHKQDSDCDFGQKEPETEEHAKGKELLFKWLKQQSLIVDVELEKWMPEIKQRPDIWFKDNKGSEYCVEYQCSPITFGYIKNRNDLYELNNVTPIWIFGTQRISNKSAVFNYLMVKYIFDPFKMIFYKNNNTQNFKNHNNFYFDDGQIYIHEEICNNFYCKLSEVMEKRLGIDVKQGSQLFSKRKYDEEFQRKMRMERNKEIEEIEIRNQRVSRAIARKLKGTTITVYNDLDRFNKDASKPSVKYLTNRDTIKPIHILRNIEEKIGLSNKSFSLYVPITLGRDGMDFIEKDCFPYAKIIFKRGVKG